MPRLQRILPSAEIPSQVPYGQASPAVFGAEAATIGESARFVQQATDQYEKVQGALTQEDMKLNLIETMSALKDEYAKREIDTRSRLGEGEADPNSPNSLARAGGLDPTQYHPVMVRNGQELLRKYESQLKYPDSVATFRAQALPFLTEQGIKARNRGFDLQQSGLEARDGMLLNKAANLAVTAPTEQERRAAFREGLDIIQSGINAGRYFGEAGASKLTGFLKSVDEGTARRDFRVPELSASVVERLLAGQFSVHMSATEQMNLGKTLQTQSDHDYQRSREAIDKWWKEQQQGFVRDKMQEAANKTLNLAQFEQDAKDWRLSREDYSAIRAELAKPAEEPASDRATLDFVISDTHSQYPRSTEKSLKAFHDAEKLNTRDWTAALDRLRETKEALLSKAESQRMQAYHDGLEDLRNRLGVPTLWEKLDPVQKKAWSLAQTAYRQRAWPLRQGAEAPSAVVEDIAPKYLGTMGSEARMDRERLIGLAREQGYSTPQQVETDFRAGRITEGRRNSLLNLFNEIKAKMKLEQQGQAPATQSRAEQFGRPNP